MKLSELLRINVADSYILTVCGFDLDNVFEFDETFEKYINEMHVYIESIAPTIDFSSPLFAEKIAPVYVLLELREKIDIHFSYLDQDARRIFWALLSKILWNKSSDYLFEIRFDLSLKDTQFGEPAKEISRLFEERDRKGWGNVDSI